METLEKDYYDKAIEDLEFAKFLLDNDKYSYSLIFCQQSIEKILKHYTRIQSTKRMVQDEKYFRAMFTHNLNMLLKDVGVKGIVDNYDFILGLSNSYISERYPKIPDWEVHTKDECEEIFEVTVKLFNFIRVDILYYLDNGYNEPESFKNVLELPYIEFEDLDSRNKRASGYQNLEDTRSKLMKVVEFE